MDTQYIFLVFSGTMSCIDSLILVCMQSQCVNHNKGFAAIVVFIVGLSVCIPHAMAYGEEQLVRNEHIATVTNSQEGATTNTVGCKGGIVNWFDSSTITIMKDGSPTLLLCGGVLPAKQEGSTIAVQATGGGAPIGNYGVSGYGNGTFTCVKESDTYRWKISDGQKVCSRTPSMQTAQSVSTQAGNGALNTGAGRETSCTVPARMLAFGDGEENGKRSDVVVLQHYLISKGLMTISTPTGYFGSLTAIGVKAFQGQNGIFQSGVFDRATRVKMQQACGASVMNEITTDTTCSDRGHCTQQLATSTKNGSRSVSVGARPSAQVTIRTTDGRVSVLDGSNSRIKCIIPVGGTSCGVWFTWVAKKVTDTKLFIGEDTKVVATGVTGSYAVNYLTPVNTTSVKLKLEGESSEDWYRYQFTGACASGSTWGEGRCVQ